MHIEIYATAHCHDIGKTTQRSGVAIILKYTDDHNRSSSRTICHPTGAATKNQADFNAIRIGLSSVVYKYRKEANVTLYVQSHLTGYLERDNGEFKKDSNKHKVELDIIRKLFSQYQNITVGTDNDVIAASLKEAKVCADNQKPKDTKTQKDG